MKPTHRRSFAPYWTAAVLILSVACTAPLTAAAQRFETVIYTGGSGERTLDLFEAHADAIDVIAPQAYQVAADGTMRGGVNADVLRVARERGVHVMPLFVNPGFNQELAHALLSDPAARRRAVDFMVREGKEYGYWGWQFDLENIHVSMRDSLTAFYRETAEGLHANNMILSIAAVPTNGGEGEARFAQYMQDNWRNSFDLAALDSIGDFISYMTYAQHGGVTAPGPIAGLPWMREMLEYALDQGVSRDRLSLGLPFYSGWWSPGYNENAGARVYGHEIGWSRATELIHAAGAPLTWSPSQGVSFAWWQQEGTFQWVFLEDARSMAAKLDLLRAYPGLRGVSIWVLGAEDPDMWDLLPDR